MTAIAATAEISLASLYASFKGKEDIYRAVIQEMVDEVSASVRTEVDAVADPTQGLLSLIDVLFEHFERRRGIFRIFISGGEGKPWHTGNEEGRLPDELRLSFHRWVSELAARAFETRGIEDLDPEVFASALLGAILQTASKAMDAGADPLTKHAPALRAIFARSLRSETHS